ncbi:hypothetical protein A2627_02480 [Candidatus Woesebacteria bacterium RIFCSPHIGHO2_01_FULL_39_28]|uniref:Glycosyltransferase RgtA/B/C/D-like domain-containing protein n=1 Tax=Candidatus Woesebacteria bacterium RIFCSPHIGHO2_01_FULL_39_28 TaxID=1802496 RepID=A0A1F7YI43_9BACT|nr:MAG: hypothetical protein A2627_02480 [Candidatus Woesebacteria bacterium RIFCSPHIGHO2_01_FULL_39_28]OGM57194.1 MAG: hypothetical protein A3A50_03340 [Candidatus Woesebacteria bacterium RIFCSPLOWO2_01_FULL_38_20]
MSALLVRIWGINFGLPAIFHFDEQLTLYTIFYSASKLLRPDQFLHPMLYPYVLIFLYGVYFLIGLILHYWTTSQQFFIGYLKDPTFFVLTGRLFTALTGVLTVWLTYKIGEKVFNRKVGLISSFFLALAFLHVQESHYIKEDVLIGLLGMISFFLGFLITKKAKQSYYIWLGVIFGLLAATKYNFFFFLPNFFYAHFLVSRSIRKFFNKKFWIVAAVAFLIFLVLNPYIVILPQRAYMEILGQTKLSTAQWVSSDGQPVWIYYLTYYLRYGLGLLLTLAFLAGSIFILIKRKSKDLLLLTTPLTFFLTLVLFKGPNFARYAVSIIPFIVLIAAYFIDKLFINNILLVFVSLFIIYPSFARVVKLDYYLSMPDTRNLAKKWIEENIPQGTKLINEGAIRTEYTSIYGPSLWMNQAAVDRRVKEVKEFGLPGVYTQALSEAVKNKTGYDLIGTIRLDKKYDPYTKGHKILSNVDEYITAGFCYIVSSSWATVDKNDDYNADFQKSLRDNYKLIKNFDPNPTLVEDLIWRVDFTNLDKVRLSDETVAGPEIKIYHKKCDLKS